MSNNKITEEPNSIELEKPIEIIKENNIAKFAFLSLQEREKRKEYVTFNPQVKVFYNQRYYEKYNQETDKYTYGCTLRAVNYKHNVNFSNGEIEDILNDVDTKSTYYFDIDKISNMDALSGIIGQKTENKSKVHDKDAGGSQNTYVEEAQDTTLNELCIDLANDDVSVFKVGLTIKVETDNKEKLDKTIERIIKRGRDRGITFARNIFEQEQEHKHLLTRLSKYNHFYTDQNLADFLPLYTDYNINYSGCLLGYKLSNGTPYFFDLRRGANKTATIIASAGAGKSHTIKKWITNLINDGVKVIIFDPKGEYTFFEEKLTFEGKKVAKNFYFSNTNSIDIFKFSKDLKNAKTAIYEFLKSFTKEDHEAELDMKVADYFHDMETEAIKEVEKENAKLEKSKSNDSKKLLTIEDVLEKFINWDTFLEFIKDEPYYKDILRITKGVEHRGIFNGTQKMTFDQPLTVISLFDIKDGESVSHLLVYLLNILKHEVHNKDQDLMLVTDEAYVLLQNRRTNRALTNITKIGRGYNTYMTFITQDLEDMQDEAIKILNNSATKIFLRSEALQAEQIMTAFKLNQDMKNTIINQNLGQALILQKLTDGQSIDHVQITATEEEKGLFKF
jgi:type IV secretory pathway VirB4 component